MSDSSDDEKAVVDDGSDEYTPELERSRTAPLRAARSAAGPTGKRALSGDGGAQRRKQSRAGTNVNKRASTGGKNNKNGKHVQPVVRKDLFFLSPAERAQKAAEEKKKRALEEQEQSRKATAVVFAGKRKLRGTFGVCAPIFQFAACAHVHVDVSQRNTLSSLLQLHVWHRPKSKRLLWRVLRKRAHSEFALRRTAAAVQIFRRRRA